VSASSFPLPVPPQRRDAFVAKGGAPSGGGTTVGEVAMSGRTLIRVGAALLALFVATPSSAARAQGGGPGSVSGGASANPTVDGGVVERQVVFDVTDENTSGVPCTSDGSPY